MCDAFRDDFRKEFKEANPDSKDVKTVRCFIRNQHVKWDWLLWCLVDEVGFDSFYFLKWNLRLLRRVEPSGSL